MIKDLIYDYSVLVKVWNHASFPGYKSRLWNANATPELCAEEKVEKRRPYVLSALSIQTLAGSQHRLAMVRFKLTRYLFVQFL